MEPAGRSSARLAVELSAPSSSRASGQSQEPPHEDHAREALDSAIESVPNQGNRAREQPRRRGGCPFETEPDERIAGKPAGSLCRWEPLTVRVRPGSGAERGPPRAGSLATGRGLRARMIAAAAAPGGRGGSRGSRSRSRSIRRRWPGACRTPGPPRRIRSRAALRPGRPGPLVHLAHVLVGDHVGDGERTPRRHPSGVAHGPLHVGGWADRASST